MGFLQHDEKKRFFISVEQPVLTLSSVVRGMLGNQECHSETNVRRRYTAKVFTVLRSIAKALRYFHLIGLVHGNVSLENCAKYDDGNWKVANIMKAQKIGAVLDSSLFSYSSPPESVETVSGRGLCFRTDLVGSPSLDAWAFGKVAYEVIVCDSLLQSVGGTSHDGGQAWLSEILNWNEKCLQRVRQELTNVGVPESGILLITACLSSDPKMRPSMDDNLMHEFWSDLRHFTSDQ
jgi:serine/threonine protein kinase